MRQDNLMAFSRQVQGDPALQALLRTTTSAEDVVAIARRHGHEIAATDLEEAISSFQGAADSELNDEQLEQVSGGFVIALVAFFAWAGTKTNQGGYMDSNNKL